MVGGRTTYHASLLEQQQVTSLVEWSDVLTPLRDMLLRAGEVGALIDLKALAVLRQHLVQHATVAA